MNRLVLALWCWLLVGCTASQPVLSPLSSPLARGGLAVQQIGPPPMRVIRPSARQGQSPLALPKALYLPLVTAYFEPCQEGGIVKALATLFVSDVRQRRRGIVCDPRLARAAQYRAEDMNRQQYFGHQDKQGLWPNHWARAFGCAIPDYYPDDSNQIESLALNYPTASSTWDAWIASPGHRIHVLGEDPFFSEQIRYGLGYSPGPWGIMYVLLTSPTC